MGKRECKIQSVGGLAEGESFFFPPPLGLGFCCFSFSFFSFFFTERLSRFLSLPAFSFSPLVLDTFFY